jgi:L-iditol 2-dehydrogenase
MPQVVCGQCLACRSGRYHICDHLKVMGFQTTGMASDLFAVDAAKVLRLPDGMGFDEGAMVEPLAVAVHAIRRAGGVAGKKVLVLGAGPIGNLVAQVAKGTGAASVLVTDLSPFRLSVARACGIDFAVDAGTESLPEALAAAFGPDRADVVLECVGAEATIGQAVALARKGTDIVVVGVFGRMPTVDLGVVQDRELRLVGTLMYQETDYREAIRLAAEGLVRLSPLVTGHFPFRDYPKAYESILTNGDRSLKVLIDVH